MATQRKTYLNKLFLALGLGLTKFFVGPFDYFVFLIMHPFLADGLTH